MSRQNPPSGMVRLVPSRGKPITLILIGEPERTGGVGGWETSSRDKQPDAYWYKGTPGSAYALPCLLNVNEIPGASAESRLDDLYAMGNPAGDQDPPSIRVYGDVPFSRNEKWKLDEVALVKRSYKPHEPDHLREVALNLTISTFMPATGILRAALKASRGKNGKRRRRIIKSKQGDTLRTIAVRDLGASSDYTQIRKWNHALAKTDPDAPLRPGTRIVLE